MKRVLVDLMPAAGAHGTRGIGRYVRGLAAAISADDLLGERVVGLVGSPNGARGPIPSVVSAIPQRMIEWRSHDLGWLSGWLADSIAARRIEATAFHQTDPRKPLRPRGIARLAVTAYDLTTLEPIVWNALRRHRRLLYQMYLRLLGDADRVLAISHTTADHIADRLSVDRERIDVIYPVVGASADVMRGPGGGEPTFLLVGAPDPHKTPELAMTALSAFRARHGEGRLRIVGLATRAQRERLVRHARACGIEDRVVIDGYLSESALEAAYASCSAVLAVSLLEGFGLPAVEAAVRGVPVVAVDTPVSREALGHSATFAAPDPEELARAMATPQPPTDAARSALRERYSAVAVAASLREAYRRLLDAP